MTTSQMLFIITGWVIGFLTSILGGYFLERRRAFRAVIGACFSVESRLTESVSVSEFHKWSIGVLEAPFFAGIGFLSCEEQKQACEAWGSYQSFDASYFSNNDFLGTISVHLKQSSMTKQDAMLIELEKIRSQFQKFP